MKAVEQGKAQLWKAQLWRRQPSKGERVPHNHVLPQAKSKAVATSSPLGSA